MGDKKKKDVVREKMYTYEDYAALPDDGKRYELVDGMLELMTSPTFNHQVISSQIHKQFWQQCENEYIIVASPIDVIVSKKQVRQPDLILIHRERLDIVTKKGVEGPPDLVIEILSPSSVKRDREGKLKSYARFDVQEYWIVDPANEAIEQYMLSDKRYDLAQVYTEDEQVQSDRVQCVSFSMNDIMNNVPKLPNQM
jgi:Uma2 family endonuclease